VKSVQGKDHREKYRGDGQFEHHHCSIVYLKYI